jgi:hypothetical protein
MSVVGAKGKKRRRKILPIEDKAQSGGFLKYSLESGLDQNPEAFDRALIIVKKRKPPSR